MVEVNYMARLGNNLFQYCFGRIIAEELGYKLSASPLDGFKNTEKIISGDENLFPLEVIEGQYPDLDSILKNKEKRKIEIKGWFQNHKYYFKRRSIIKKWLEISNEHKAPEFKPSRNDVVINVRRTDYIHLKWALPFSFYNTALELARPEKVYIVTDDPKDFFFWKFLKYKPIFFNGSPVAQIDFISRFEKIIISQSSFSWWGSFLSEAQQIYCPIPLEGVWSDQFNQPPRLIPDENIFIQIPCRECYKHGFSEKIYYSKIYQRFFRDFRNRLFNKINSRQLQSKTKNSILK